MAVYCFKCPLCDERREIVRPMKDWNLPEICECGQQMIRNFIAEHSAVRSDYSHPIISTSLAFNTQDLNEHRRQHPDIELKVDKIGRTAYPVFQSLSQKRKYLKKRGWVDVNSFT